MYGKIKSKRSDSVFFRMGKVHVEKISALVRDTLVNSYNGILCFY